MSDELGQWRGLGELYSHSAARHEMKHNDCEDYKTCPGCQNSHGPIMDMVVERMFNQLVDRVLLPVHNMDSFKKELATDLFLKIVAKGLQHNLDHAIREMMLDMATRLSNQTHYLDLIIPTEDNDNIYSRLGQCADDGIDHAMTIFDDRVQDEDCYHVFKDELLQIASCTMRAMA